MTQTTLLDLWGDWWGWMKSYGIPVLPYQEEQIAKLPAVPKEKYTPHNIAYAITEHYENPSMKFLRPLSSPPVRYVVRRAILCVYAVLHSHSLLRPIVMRVRSKAVRTFCDSQVANELLLESWQQPESVKNNVSQTTQSRSNSVFVQLMMRIEITGLFRSLPAPMESDAEFLIDFRRIERSHFRWWGRQEGGPGSIRNGLAQGAGLKSP